ncbi:hypothetical protein Bequi_06155 [Brachybacterium sp. JHP9]|uniref:Uncharacterized protein n=1 Tax=Brachybacterium equifaecis TaxID=2910770 RepID=A0ABT0R131_9MICO|nr:hypothetical protein [Brachybacterium equifaecis]MCL6422974.1 hypothetical protein [Brachybacterium equifaecis]
MSSEALDEAEREEPGAGVVADPESVFGPSRSVVLATILAGILFAVVLEFLVIVSFIGQKLWRSPLLGTDPIFTLPLVLGVGAFVLTVLAVVRILTMWLQVDAHGIRVNGLLRRTRPTAWSEAERVVAVHNIQRASSAAELLDAASTLDGLYVMSREKGRMAAVSGRFFGADAQSATLQRADAAGVPIEEIDEITVKELWQRFPGALSFAEGHPNLTLVALVGFFVGHNVLTFFIWGM